MELGRQSVRAHGSQRRAHAHRDLLLVAYGKAYGIAGDRRAEIHLPQDLAGLLVECAEAAVRVTAEDQATGSRQQREHRGPLLILPERFAALDRDRVNGADVRMVRRDLLGVLESV